MLPFPVWNQELVLNAPHVCPDSATQLSAQNNQDHDGRDSHKAVRIVRTRGGLQGGREAKRELRRTPSRLQLGWLRVLSEHINC